MNSNLQLEQALLAASLSGVSLSNKRSRPSSPLAGGFYVAPCMAVAVAFGDDFARSYGNPVHQAPQRDYLARHTTNGLDFSPTVLENIGSASPVSKRVKLPLIRSRRPGSVELTNAQIEELLD